MSASDSEQASNRPGLIYLHGFRSSPQSDKVTELRQWLDSHQVPVELHVPDLGFEPAEAIQRVSDIVECFGDRPCGLMGSSLGGYYASVVAARHRLRAVLINPAVAPYQLLDGYIGTQTNLYTGEAFEVTRDHMLQLQEMEPGASLNTADLMVLLQTADETLDYRDACRRYSSASQWIQPGGDHRFQNFPRVLPAAMAFLGIPLPDTLMPRD
ncbi:YqiA/YcfP family alpha/beta fold hydrolase [Marinobacter sp. BGYM27]|uniref:YqiA/YcfP family alpha/beta fold hydrolase n=1 Tax=unclassified Marinobacter TaxID=83889 RepID=UPI0021A4CD03|nr:YqiA/YcfP family alpha/beta fold hydrolase [Marinobacter sp. BGYM27]MDG5501349.1 YqiA/YcfP family alpha/beta fold hydrolase [Marinobacter sp. BGYM27]